MALFPDPFNTLLGLQDALQAFRTSGWLQAGPSGGGSYPPVNIFRKGDDLVLIAEVPGINKSDLELQVKGRTIRLAGTKTVKYPENASLHRRERSTGRFDRSLTLPVEVDPDGVKAECHDGVQVDHPVHADGLTFVPNRQNLHLERLAHPFGCKSGRQDRHALASKSGKPD